jgi:hypothetical protein
MDFDIFCKTLRIKSVPNFYSEIPAVKSLVDIILDPQNVQRVPENWYVVIADIMNSTKYIEAGRYKDVNALGASVIAGVLNEAGDEEVPFVFGGDGATFLIPPNLLPSTKKALSGATELGQTQFGMELISGLVPVGDIREAGYDIWVGKLDVSPDYVQAMFLGGGAGYAETLVKNQEDSTKKYRLENKSREDVNFSGLECRWQDIPSAHGETVSLIIKATTGKPAEDREVYGKAFKALEEVYGMSETYHPILPKNLHVGLFWDRLLLEAKIQKFHRGFIKRSFYFTKIWLTSLALKIVDSLGFKLGNFDFNKYKLGLLAATDFRKLDDAMRMVIAGTQTQREKLINYLEKERKKDKLVYGLHVSDRATLTCLVFARFGRQVHFVDGADGGYALAAVELKKQLKERIKLS